MPRSRIVGGIELERYGLIAFMIAAGLLFVAGIYLAAGLLFALAFVGSGVRKIDPHAAHVSWGFRVLIIPGTMAFWPLLLRRWIKGAHEPPEEGNAHRRLAPSDNACGKHAGTPVK